MRARHISPLIMFTLVTGAGLVIADTPTPKPQQQGEEQFIISQFMSGLSGLGLPGSGNGLADFQELTKDMKSDEGLFTLWFYPPGTKDKDAEKLLCQIPAGFLGEKFMLSMSIAGGGPMTGFQWGERVVQWELLDKQLLLVEPQTQYVVAQGKEVADAVQRTYPDRIRIALPIVSKTPAGDPVIDLGPFLKSDFANVAWLGMFEGDGYGMVNESLSKWMKKKSFDLNVEIGTELAIASSSQPGSHHKKLIHYSFWKLPETNYTPRVADDRIGYFLTANEDWSKPAESRDLYNRYIDRWQLEKRDPSLDLCEPKKPIIFYIEKTVPVKYRRAVRDGILEWNKAFEKIGFLNAVVVRQQEDDNEWKDLDPEDMNYSFFRWIVNGWGFAMGPHRSNPFTGQIYDADIIFDDAMVRYFGQEADTLLVEEAMAMKLGDPAMAEFLEKHPQWKREFPGLEDKDGTVQQRIDLLSELKRKNPHRHGRQCDYMYGMRHQVAYAGAMLADAPKEVREQFIYDIIKEVVSHEVGHTLGLRHNFKASSIYSVDELKQRRGTGEALSGSVMDYNPSLFLKDHSEDAHFITPTIGPYDYWAIEYGYRPFDQTYKPQENGDTDPEEEEVDESKAEASKPETPAAKPQQMPNVQEMMKELPPEVLAQLPPEVKEMLESGEAQVMFESMAASGAAPGMPASKPSVSGFKAAPSGELGMLQDIAKRAAEPELAYATDEDTTFYGLDPLSNRFDASSEPMKWASERIELIDHRLKNILDWAVKDQESWYHLRSAFTRLWFEKSIVQDYVGRFIGGQYVHRHHKGDPNGQAPFEPVDANLQREALNFIAKNLYSDDFFKVDPAVLNHLTASRWSHGDVWASYRLDFPIHTYIARLQWWNILDRLHPDILRRIHDAEFKSADGNKFTLAEYLQTIQDACWKDTLDVNRVRSGTWTNAAPFVSDIRRSLQRQYLLMLELLMRVGPGELTSLDIHAMITHSARQLSQRMGKVLETGKLDFATEAHLSTCQSRIERVLESELSEIGF